MKQKIGHYILWMIIMEKRKEMIELYKKYKEIIKTLRENLVNVIDPFNLGLSSGNLPDSFAGSRPRHCGKFYCLVWRTVFRPEQKTHINPCIFRRIKASPRSSLSPCLGSGNHCISLRHALNRHFPKIIIGRLCLRQHMKLYG